MSPARFSAFSKRGVRAVIEDLTRGSHFLLDENRITEMVFPEGVEGTVKENNGIVDIEMRITKSQEDPVFLCFAGYTDGVNQDIRLKLVIEENVKVTVLSRCIFPNNVRVLHKMISTVEIKRGGHLTVLEEHYHGPAAKTEIITKSDVKVGEGAVYKSSFRSIRGRMGHILLDYKTDLAEKAFADMLVSIQARAHDHIEAKESAVLRGKRSRAFLKSRIVVREMAIAEVFNRLVAEGEEAQGHIDCKEITLDNGLASTTPELITKNPTAHLTHEAYVGKLSEERLLPLMAKGLSEEEAVEMLLKAMLR